MVKLKRILKRIGTVLAVGYLLLCALALVEFFSFESLKKRLRPIEGTQVYAFNNISEIAQEALAHYPEIATENIIIRPANIDFSMNARPCLAGLLIPFFPRVYIININADENSPLFPYRAGRGGVTGCLIHEFGHIVDYQQRVDAAVWSLGMGYFLSPKSKETTEKRADLIAAKHCGGDLTYEFAKFIFYEADVDQTYLQYKEKYYYSPAELKDLAIQFCED